MVLYFVLRCCVLFWNLLVVFRCRIEFIENICRKLFSQYRPAGNDAVVMVNESHTIDSADRVNAENRVDILRFEQSPALVPCIVWVGRAFRPASAHSSTARNTFEEPCSRHPGRYGSI